MQADFVLPKQQSGITIKQNASFNAIPKDAFICSG
jgi:hypothetical protein